MDDKYIILFDDINFEKKIGETKNSLTYCAKLATDTSRCATKILKDEKMINEEKFREYVKNLQQMNHPAIIPFIGFCLSSQNVMEQNIIVTKYASYLSLQDIFDKINEGEALSWWDPVRQFIIIYGMAHALEYLHSQNITHKKLTPSNILIDENLEPQITDFNLVNIYPQFDYSISNIIDSKLLYYIDPYTLNQNGKVTAKSDIYSFAIIVIQILTGNTHIYEDESDLEKLITEIKNGLIPMIPSNFPEELRKLIQSCLNADQTLRPPFSRVCSQLDSIIDSLPEISQEIFKEYKEKIKGKKEDDMSPEVRQMKKAADNGDPEMMYMYAIKRLDGINCKQNQTEATRYLKMAKKRGNRAAEHQLALLKSNNGTMATSVSFESLEVGKPQVENDEPQEDPQDFNNDIDQDSDKNNYAILADDPTYDQPELNINDLLMNIDKEMNNETKFTYNKSEVEKQNFIFTQGAEERLQKLFNYIMVGVPVLLEGPTGTSKTLSSEIVCKLLGRELIRFNLSSETKTQDLIGRYVGDENSWAGISQQDGPFFRAFQEGKVLLLDEINLASASVLQCIEEALDSGILSIEIPGRPLKSIKMDPNFRVIATQNPNKGSYAHKRQNLGLKFYSRFQVINFPAFTEKELLFIGKGLAEKFGYNKLDIIEDLVKFHKRWSENPLIADDTQCFTIREIAATVKALSQKESIYDTIMTIYGARYQAALKEELKKVLNNYPRLINDSKEKQIPQFPGCYPNKSLESAVKSTLFSLENGRNVILTGKEGCGKTQVALWISDYYNKNMQESDNGNQSFFCVCTEEIKVADLVGHQAPSGKSDGTSELIKWQDGFLTKAIKLGKCSVLESLDEAPATVTERLNGLLDQKYDNQQKYFDIPENSSNPRVPIKESFRILATANIEKIAQMSPAFLNRFDIIVLENQIDENIAENSFKDLLSIILDKYCKDLSLKVKTQDSNDQETTDDLLNDSDFEFSDDSDDETNDTNNNNNDNNSKDNSAENNNENKSFEYSQNIIPMIYNKLKNEKNISRISKVCNAIVKLCYAFQDNKQITDKDVVDFAFLLLQNNKEFEIPKEIEKELLQKFQEITENTDDPFFYKDSPSLCSFLAKLEAYSIIEQPVCVSGPTGAGKTSAARAFARMRPHSSTFKSGFQMHSFHSGTKVSHFFGSTTLLDGNIVFHDGTLTKSLKLGLVFIADEFNLSTQSVMKSLSLALDPTIGKNVFIPGIGQVINISPEFHFIACQNELGTLGRNAIPDSISQRFVYIDYPKPLKEDIQKICINISKENFTKKTIFKPEDEELARCIANYMIRLNERKFIYIPQWSLRDITKLFRRIYPQNSFKKFKDITPIHHVLFYTMSVVSSNDISNVIDDVRSIMKLSFNLNDGQVDEYIECYKATPEIREIENQGFYMMKGPKVGISITRIKKLIIDKTLPSLWNAIFQVYLSDEKEPILLMGNSGFKTFLAKQFLPKAQTITLNQETNVAQLLGSSGFMTNVEAKLFYIDYICKIMQNDSLSFELRRKWENGNLTEDDIIPLIQKTKRGTIPYSFHYALDHLAEKLLEDQTKNKDCVLSNTTLEFRPGLFLNSILQGQSLILKDLSNLPTIVLERFNELFSGKQNITLSEDIHNTFTPQDYKELTNFSDSFRVFATCPANSPSRLSEAVLSRFTVISVPEYTSDEQKIVLKSYIQMNKLAFDQSDISRLSEFASAYFINLKNHITFPQMIKVIEITSKLNQETSLDIQKLNIGITLYRVLGGILESNKKKEILFNQIKNYFIIPDIYKSQKNDECILHIDHKENILGVTSNISNLFLKCTTAQECKDKVAFTGSFNDLLDLLHMTLTIHNPLILEGPPGQGKHTAIYYIANMLNIDIVHIMISQSTKVEDLFGKDVISRQQDGIHVNMVETQFIKIIKSADNLEKKSLIILENINSASPALLNALVPVFDTYSSSILLPNGSTCNKGKFDIIGIFNTQQISSSKDKLPSSLINSSIYHIVPKPKESEILNIILVKFCYAGLTNDEANRFNKYYNQARDVLSKEASSSEVFTMNDIEKYILFRTLTKEFFDETTISQMIFAYKFSSDVMIQKMLKELKLENMKFSPLFNYNVPPKDLFIRISNDVSNGLLLPLISKPKDISLIGKIDSLTLPQKHCLIFLACSILAKRSCVIQGDTASGKSFLIRLFADLVGAKLNVFQMNSDSNVSMLAGQSVLNDEISQEDINKFKKAFTNLMIDQNIHQYMEETLKIDIKDQSTFKPTNLKKLLDYIKSIEIEIHGELYFPEIEKAVQLIKETMNPVNRFEHKESAFIHAIKKGEWVLIDGIESAPSVIAEKISSLCGENPELNLYEYGPEFYFSKSKIHDNFHLFITYNPNSMKESQNIDQTFLVKSVTFTLPAIDERIENSAQMLLGSLINLKYSPELSKEVAVRYASMHQFAKSKSQANPDDFAGDIQFNGRTLKFATKAFSTREEKANEKALGNLAKPICFSTKSFYWNSYINEQNAESFHRECIKCLKQQPDNDLLSQLQIGDMTPEVRNKKILVLLRNIQKFVLGKTNKTSFTVVSFLQLCNLIRISDLQFVQKYIKETIEIIKINSNQVINPILTFGSLNAISSLFESIISPDSPIKKEHTFLSIKDGELKNNKSISKPLSKFDLLVQLFNGKLCSEQSSILLENEIYSNLIHQISIIASNSDKNLIIELFKQLESNNELIDFVDSVFPYFTFKESSLSKIAYWLPLSKTLIKNGIRFSFTIDENKVEFNKSSACEFSFDLIMNEKNNLSLSKNSIIHYMKNKKSMKVKEHNENENEKYDFEYYSIISDLSANPKQSADNSLLGALLSKSKKLLADKQIESPSENLMLSLKDIFLQKDIPIINLIWNIIYTLSEDDIINLSKIVHPIESKLLLSSLKMFQLVDKKLISDIIIWSNWASIFESKVPILFKSILGSDVTKMTSSSNIDQLITCINEEIAYLQKAPDQMKDFWDSEDLIDACKKSLIQLMKIKNDNDNYAKELEIQEKINGLKNILINAKVIEKYRKMKTELVTQLGLIKEFTEDKFIFAQKNVNQFLSLAKSASQDDKSSFIIWPQINVKSLTSNYKKTDNIKLFEALIWYSQILAILKEINAGNDLMKNLWKLNDFEEMAFPREVLLTNLINNTNSGLTMKDKNQALFTLNCHMILKLLSISKSLIEDPQKISEIIDKYRIRSDCDETELQWVYQTVSNLPPDFCLSIPTFEPNDLVFLIVNKKSHSDYRNGPLFVGVENLVFLKDMKDLMKKDFTSFSEAAQSIAKIAYMTVVAPNENPPSDYTKLKNAFNNQNRVSAKYYEIVRRIKKIFDIADALDKWTEQKLIFDDVSFLTNDWKNDQGLLNLYPSLVFWICKNQQTTNQIISKYKNFDQNPKQIPLWLLALRMMSSQNCIEFVTKAHGNLSEIISSETTKLTKKYLIDAFQQNSLINYDWINILISNLPQQILNIDIKTIHDFFSLLSLDDQNNLSREINQIKNNSIQKAISKITKMMLSNRTDELISSDLLDKKSMNQFLVSPSKYVQTRINDKISEITHSILIDKSAVQLRSFLNSLDNFKNLIQNLKNAINEDQEEMKTFYEEKIKNENEQLKAKKINETRSLVNKYNEIVWDILHSYKHKEINDKVKNLKVYHSQLQAYPELFKKEGIDLVTFRYQSQNDFVLNVKKNNELIKIKVPKAYYKDQYLYPGEEIRREDNSNIWYHITKITVTHFDYIKEYFDLDAIISRSTNVSSRKPVIVFGNKYQDSKVFLEKLDNIYKELTSLDEKFFAVLEFDPNIRSDIFSYIEKINNSLQSVKNNLQVEFSDHSPAPNSKRILQGEMKDYLDNLYPLLKKLMDLSQSNLYPIWKAMSSNRQFTKLFNYQYDIQIPKINHKPNLIPNFSAISNINSLASPIICISPENKIICSVNKLKCQIGPIFSSHIYTPYSINILSFINENVICQIDHLSDPQHSMFISIKDNLKSNEPIQLFVKPPNTAGNEPEILTLKGNITITVESYDPFILPFEIILGILPLKVRIHCLEYKLAEEEQSLRLCCDKIDSGAKINFEIINYYIHDYFLLSADVESLDENEANQPEISINKVKREISLSIPNVEDPTRCHFNLKIALSQNLITTIHCDFIIMPLVFAFEMYDFFSRKYVDTSCQLTFIPGSTKTLHFRMTCLFPFKQVAQIKYDLPQSITLSREGNPITEKFNVNGDCTFKLKLHISRNYTYCPSYGYHHIDLEIGNTKKSIQIKFVDPSSYIFYPDYPSSSKLNNNEFLMKLPTYLYDYNKKKWEKLLDNDQLIKSKPNDKPYIMVSPFKIYTNTNRYNIIDYHQKYCDYVSVSNYQNINFLQLTIHDNQKHLINEEKSSATSVFKYCPNYALYVICYETKYYYYSIIGYEKDNSNNWFPAFDTYPDISKIMFLNYDEKNVSKAKDNIKSMKKSIKSPSFKKITKAFTSYSSLPVDQTNFAVLMALLLDKTIVLNIEYIKDHLPNEIQEQLANIIDTIKVFINDKKGLSNEISTIISHNLILKFAQIFIAKYKEIESHQFCLQMPLTNNEIEAQKKIAMDEFLNYDSGLIANRSTSTTFQFSEKQNALSKVATIQLPEELQRYECYIISEKDNLQSCSISDGLGSFNFDSIIDKDESIFSDTMDSIASLPPITLPSVLSIQKLLVFYSVCSQGATVLPTYIRSMQIKKKDQKDSELYFATLLDIYKEITKESTLDRSILADYVNSFIESFKNCVKRLKRAGVDFSKMNLPQSCNDSRYHYNQDFIRSPDIETPTLRHIPWKTKYQVSENYAKFADPSFNKSYTSMDTFISRQLDNIINPIIEEEEDFIDLNPEPEPIHEISDQEKKLIVDQVAAVNNKEEDEEEIENADDKDQQNKPDNKPILAVNPKVMTTQTVDSESVDGLFSQFSELDGIERVLRRIKEMKKDAKLKFLNSVECKIENQKDKFATDINDFPVKSLIDNSQHLIANLICRASDSNCPFLYMSCNLLIDCSSFISVENKLYSFMLLISFSYALSALEIPFSIAIVADQKFRFVLKPFEEEISMLVLQRVLDCLFIKRYRTNIADTFHHAIEFMKCPYQERTQRAVFIFSNGLDENLILTQSWKESILNNINNSFGLIFVKSKLLENQKFSSIQTMWDEFNKAVDTAQSITKLIAINADINTSTFDSITDAFATVLSRKSDQKYPFDLNKVDIKPDFKQNYIDLAQRIFENVRDDIEYNFDGVSPSIFRKINQRFDVIGTRFPKLDIAHYRNKTEKITNSSPEHQIKESFEQFIHRTVNLKKNSYRPLLETIFKPNKASQTVLSSVGTDFDITALILNLINPVPDPLIYLEEKGGLIRNYGISIVIDSSKSCFNPLSSSHSYQTIKTLFAALSAIDVPCIDIVVATKATPIVLCSEIPSLRIFNDKSPIWPSLFNCIAENYSENCDLESAIHTAYDIRRMRTVDSTSYMFVFTDGLFQKEQKDLIKGHVMTCLQSGISVFGIGIGIYPSGIIEMFPQAIFATNPNYLIHGIASCFGDDSTDSFDDSIMHLAPEQSPFSEIKDSFDELIKKENKPVFKDLKKYLLDVQHAMDAFSDMYNEEQESRNASGELINPEGMNTEMYVQDILKGQKILIVMPYDCRANLKENPKVNPKYLLEPECAGEKAYVKKAVEFFGIDVVIVQNYKDAVKELTKQTQSGLCDYYATWVISGLPYDIPLPDGGNQHLVLQFIDCLIQFWNNGGSVVMFAEGDPLTFQANLFLERIVFPGNKKTNLRVGGNHAGKKLLKGDISGKLERPGMFNKSPLAFRTFQRASLAHNLVEIYEGETISFAPNDKTKYLPFTPFMKDSENGISALFYSGGTDKQNQTGDIIIDCGYTKLFDKMTEKGTFRYVQNIAGWTAQCESRRIRGIQPKNFRPKAVVFTLDESQKCPVLQAPPKLPTSTPTSSYFDLSSLRHLFAIDYSGSVGGEYLYHNEVRSIFNQYYRNGDSIMIWGSQARMIDYSRMVQIYTNREGNEGTDPSVIAQKLVSDRSISREHLILVTDGQVDSGSIQRSDSILRSGNVQFKYVTTYVIGSGGDLSVGAPFGRGCGSETVEVKSNGQRRVIKGANASDFNVLDQIDNISSLDQFKRNSGAIFSATKQKMIGTSGDPSLRSKFENLKNRLKSAGCLVAKADQILSILIGMASGTLQNVFDINTISAMEDSANSW